MENKRIRSLLGVIKERVVVNGGAERLNARILKSILRFVCRLPTSREHASSVDRLTDQSPGNARLGVDRSFEVSVVDRPIVKLFRTYRVPELLRGQPLRIQFAVH